MRIAFSTFVVLVGMALLPAPAFLQEKGGDDVTGPYNVAEKWPLPLSVAKPGYIWGSTGGIFAETPNRIFIANRGELKLPEKLPRTFTGFWGSLGEQATTPTTEFRNCIVVVDATGKVTESWTQWDKLFEDGRGPHSVSISPYDPEHNVWVTDDIHHQVFKFSNDGKKLLMTLGERDEPGNDDKHFKRPTDVAWLPDGTFFVSDGYGNTRVVKFDKNGKFLMAWGTPGTGPGQFNTPHSITTDRNRRVYVSDRANNRIQVFDENGKFLDMWNTGLRSQPYAHLITTDQFLWESDGGTNRIVKYDLNGKYLYGWGGPGGLPGQFNGPHSITTDQDGNLYLAEVFNGRVQKFRPKPGADRAKMVGQELRYGTAGTQ